jgi:hypothetical protein
LARRSIGVTIVASMFCAACVVLPSPERLPRDDGPERVADAMFVGSQSPPSLPLRAPIRGVMAGIVDFSAQGVFETTTSEAPPSMQDWLAAGLATTNLIGASSLISLPGTGRNDAAWASDPVYRIWAEAMQAASINVGNAVMCKNRSAILPAADQLATSCHAHVSSDIPSSASQFAFRNRPREENAQSFSKLLVDRP